MEIQDKHIQEFLDDVEHGLAIDPDTRHNKSKNCDDYENIAYALAKRLLIAENRIESIHNQLAEAMSILNVAYLITKEDV